MTLLWSFGLSFFSYYSHQAPLVPEIQMAFVFGTHLSLEISYEPFLSALQPALWPRILVSKAIAGAGNSNSFCVRTSTLPRNFL